jgi:hypothetical protein
VLGSAVESFTFALFANPTTPHPRTQELSMHSITRGKSHRTLVLCSLLLLAACGGGDPDPNPPPADNGTPPLAANYTDIPAEGGSFGQQKWADGSVPGARGDGVECTTSENYHLHGLVSIYQNGTRLAVPKNIGINTCTYELHTHDATGVVHVEAPAQKRFTFGQFFTVWGQPLGASNVGGIAGTVKFYVIENETVKPASEPADVEITAHRELAIVIGTPPAALVRHRWPGAL